jgi:hypothetical protein
MQDSSLEDALAAIGLAIYRSEAFGAAPPPRQDLIGRALARIRDYVCPRRMAIVQAATSQEAQLATMITDSLASYAAKIPLPATSASRLILSIGVDRFCARPEDLLDE